jgi:MFS family permease
MTTHPENLPNLQEHNFWKVYLYRFLSEFWLIAPILVPFYGSNGLSATQVFVVQAIYAVSLLIFEIPSGYLSDVVGRKSTLILGAVLLPVGLFVYAFSHGFFGFAVAEIILGAAGSMRSGTDSALIYDTLIKLRRESEYNRFEGTAEFFQEAAHASSAILGGFLALTSLRFPFYLNVVSALMLFPLAVSFVEPERKKLDAKSPFLEILAISKRCMTEPRIRSLILFSSLVSGGIVTGVWSYYMYYMSIGISVGLFGVIFAVFGLFSALGASQSHYIEQKLGSKRAFYSLLLMGPIFLLLGQIRSAHMIPLILLNGFIGGYAVPLFRGHINKLIESDVRATVLSVGAMAGGIAFILLSPTFGRVVDASGLFAAYTGLGIFFLAAGAWCLIEMHRHKVI